MKKSKLPSALKGMAFTVFADFLIIGGSLLFFLGLSRVVSDLLNIEGSGEMVVGVCLFLLGIIVLSRLKLKVVGMNVSGRSPPTGVPPQPAPPTGPTTYR